MERTYKNPILYADYSDPDAIRVGEDYFMVASSFSNAPGLPLLHSKDLVHWQVVNYVIDKIPEERYDEPTHGCGVWAPAIRYHEGVYYVCFPMPDEGIYMTTATDPFGKWSEPVNIRPGAGWIDPCPFWDEDGNAYLVAGVAKSRIGYKSVLHLVRMQPDGMGIFGEEVRIFDGNENDQVTIEGPKMYKRNGYYYIFAPAGGVKPGWQTVLRSKNIWGPYEYKVVLRQGNTTVNGPHQGAWVDTVTGEDWFIHFQDVYSAGRITHLQPMYWENDWPVIGVKSQETNEYGEPVYEYQMPNVGAEYEPCMPECSDDFATGKLGKMWQWNANWKDNWYDIEDGKLKLYAIAKEPERAMMDTKNLLIQKWPAKEFVVDTKMDFSCMESGDSAGIVSAAMTYAAIVCTKTENGVKIVKITGEQLNGCKTTKQFEEEIENLVTNELYFKYEVKMSDNIVTMEGVDFPQEEVTMSYSMDGINYKIGCKYFAHPGRWVGVKNGVFCYHEGTEDKNSYAKVEYVKYSI